MEIKQYKVKTNGDFALLVEPYAKKQHPNQQNGLDKYVDVLDLGTGLVNSVKLYENSKGLHFKKGGTHYLSSFTRECVVVPYQVYEVDDTLLSSDVAIIDRFEGVNSL